MGTLYLVRHGQASFGAADYDQLSDLGVRQCQALGEHLRERGQPFEAVLRGTLRRQVQSLDAISAGYGALPATLEWPGLNEYDGDALAQAIHDGPPPDTRTPEGYREHFRLLREGLRAWIAGRSTPRGMPTHAQWLADIVAALDHVRQNCSGDVLLVSSGGPISAAVAQVLQSPAEVAIDLNMRIRNSAITELAFTPRRHMLVSFNSLPHLQGPARRDWITHS